MLSLREVELFLQRTPPDLQDIVWELRNVIASVAPDAGEAIRWGGLSYFHEGRGGIVGRWSRGRGADQVGEQAGPAHQERGPGSAAFRLGKQGPPEIFQAVGQGLETQEAHHRRIALDGVERALEGPGQFFGVLVLFPSALQPHRPFGYILHQRQALGHVLGEEGAERMLRCAHGKARCCEWREARATSASSCSGWKGLQR